jgi:hypothetical protein
MNGAAEHFAEKLNSCTSGAKAPTEKKAFYRSIETLRHPTAEFQQTVKPPLASPSGQA